MNLFWFFLICRILARFSRGVVRDERSEDEGEGEGEGEEVEEGKSAKGKKEGKLEGRKAGREKEEEEEGKTNGTAVKPKVTLNGEPLSPSPNESQFPVSARKATLRKR